MGVQGVHADHHNWFKTKSSLQFFRYMGERSQSKGVYVFEIEQKFTLNMKSNRFRKLRMRVKIFDTE